MSTEDISHIEYRISIDGLEASQFVGFFAGWPNPPSAETLRLILSNSTHRVVALEVGSSQVIGFINCISDGILAAYIPLLEVRADFQGRGTGSELVRRLLDSMPKYYMLDLVCDESLIAFYERFGLKRISAMGLREYASQSGLGL